MAFTAQQLAERMPDARELLSDEPEMESTQHYQRLALLVSHLERCWRERDDFFIGANPTAAGKETGGPGVATSRRSAARGGLGTATGRTVGATLAAVEGRSKLLRIHNCSLTAGKSLMDAA